MAKRSERPALTQERLHQLLHYDPATGIFTWLRNKGPFMKAGMCAGTHRSGGYKHIRINGVAYMEARLAVFYMTGEWPEKLVDHQNRVRDFDAFDNLRGANHQQNAANMRGHGKSLKGVRKLPSGRFWARITVGGREFSLGTFNTEDLAHQAYCDRAAIEFGEYASSGQEIVPLAAAAH